MLNFVVFTKTAFTNFPHDLGKQPKKPFHSDVHLKSFPACMKTDFLFFPKCYGLINQTQNLEEFYSRQSLEIDSFFSDTQAIFHSTERTKYALYRKTTIEKMNS